MQPNKKTTTLYRITVLKCKAIRGVNICFTGFVPMPEGKDGSDMGN